jgi:AraC-like DNA-binding protein
MNLRLDSAAGNVHPNSHEVPLGNFPLFETTSIDEAQARVGRLFCSHALHADMARSRFYSRVNSASLGELSLSYVRYDGGIQIDIDELEGFYLVSIPLSGTTRVTCGGQSVETGAAIGTIQSPGMPVQVEWGPAGEKIVVKIPESTVERRVINVIGDTLTKPIKFHLGMNIENGFGEVVRNIVVNAAVAVNKSLEIQDSKSATNLIEEMLLNSLLLGQQHTYSERLMTPASPAIPYYVRRAEEFIAENLSKPISYDDIVSASDVSGRTLLSGFKRFRNTTPMQFMKAQRLEMVHADLLQATPDDTITKIAMRWGFFHLGRFSNYYFKRFGELPSDTINQHFRRLTNDVKGDVAAH